jgi:hypothetical protein
MDSSEQIIYLYSNVSGASTQAKPLMDNLVKLSPIPIIPLNVDTKQVKKMILKSKEVKVETVPSLIIHSKIKNKTEVYEGKQFYDTVNSLIQAFTMLAQQKAETQSVQMSVPTSSNRGGKTSLQQIFQNEDTVSKPGQKRMGRTKLNLPNDVSPFAEDGRMMIGNLDQPVRGEGHDSMKRSSISEMGMMKDEFSEIRNEVPKRVSFEDVQSNDFEEDEEPSIEEVQNIVKQTPLKPAIKSVPVKVGKKIEMLEDLSVVLDSNKGDQEEENYGLEKTNIDVELMRSSGSGGGESRKDQRTMSMNSTKAAAEAMMKAREREQTGPTRR